MEPAPIAALRTRLPFPGAPLLLQLPAIDLPFAARADFLGYGARYSPSMRQSLLWSTSLTQLANQSIGWAWEGGRPGFWNSFLRSASLVLFDYYFLYMPLGDAWLHEEWHRAVMTRDGVSSYDGLYHWDIGSDVISVDHVTDADLAAMKANHPADFVRLPEAGIEGEIEAIRLMRRNNFFLGRNSDYDLIHWWITQANVAFYIYACGTNDLESDIDKMNQAEKAVSIRDFTGFDFRAWVYDLHHPDEPYAAGPRGRTHPTGTGFDRYLRYSDLTAEERSFLKLQAGLDLLNFVSPQFFGRDWLPGINPWDHQGFLWNFGLVHHLNPFGYDLGGDFLVRRGKWSWAFCARANVNGSMVLPEFSGELFRYPVSAGHKAFFLTGESSLWLQPKDLRYRTTDVTPGGSLSAGVAMPIWNGLEGLFESDAKTEGWVPGNVYLDAAAEARIGLQWLL